MNNRAEKMGELTRQRYAGGPYSQPEGTNDGLRNVHQWEKRGLVVAGVWPNVDRIVQWGPDGTRSELSVKPVVVPGTRRARTVFVPLEK